MSSDDLIAFFSPTTVSEAFWDAAGDDADAILERTGLGVGARVLVLPRGTGQHAVAFANRGLEVTAVGPDNESLALATQRAEDEGGLDIDFVVAEPEDYRPASEFDLVLNLSSSFDFVRGAREDGVLAALQGALKPGGWVVMRMVNLDSTQRRVDVKDWKEGPKGLLVLEELEHDWDIGWVSYRWLIVTQGGQRFEFHLGHRGYDANWIIESLRDVGFETVELVGSLDGQEFASDRPVVIYARV